MHMSEAAIREQDVTYPFTAQARPGYLALPEGDSPVPGIIVIHEIYGLNDNIREITRRFAHQGYAALAVDLFAGRNRALCMFRTMGSMLVSPLDNRNLNELKAALTYLGEQPHVDRERLGAIGFCLGGGFAIAWAFSDTRLKVIAPFYAYNPRTLDAAARSCPVVGSYPGQDFTASQGRQLDAALTKFNIPHDIKIYPGAHHSFFNDQGRSYDATAAEGAWQRVMAFFGDRLGSK
jgi:carboxymethylenebutenolidase